MLPLAMAAAALALGAAQPTAGEDVAAKAAVGAAFIFGQACLLRLNVAQTADAYAAGSDTLGRGIVTDTPALKGLLTLDGADRRGCRVRYAGPRADEAWTAFSAFYAKATQAKPASCTAEASSANQLRATCVSEADSTDPKTVTRRADLTIERSSTAVSASLTNVRP